MSSHSTLRRIAILAALLLLLLASAAHGVRAAAPSPAPTTAPTTTLTPRATATATPVVTPAATPKSTPTASAAAATPAAPVPPAPRVAAPRALGPQAVPSAALALPNCLVSCDLYARTGSIVLAGTTVPIWGFTTGPTGATDNPTLPGPTLITIAGGPLSITLHNLLPAADGNVALEVPGAVVPRDSIEVSAAGAPHAYQLGGLAPGTYLYEAGTTDQGARQVAMGLSGILIVRPSDFLTTPTAYGPVSATSPNPGPFNAEATVLVSEIDTEFNKDPMNRDLVEYKPNFFLVNGRAFDPANPKLGKIDVVAGDLLLLHEANLGLRDREVNILGARQSILANDSHLLKNPSNVAANFLTPGQVADAFVQVDPSLTSGTQLPLFDSGMHLHNDATSGLGGMMTYLDVQPGIGGLPGGPVTSSVTAFPAISDGTQPTTVTATLTAKTGSVTAAEWFVDNVGTAGSGTPIPVPANAGTATVTFTLTAAQLLNAITAQGGTPDADHIIWVHAKDPLNWGEVSGDVISLNVSGPVISALSVHPARTNGALPNDQDGTNDALVMATAAASLSGWTVDSAELCIDNSACASGSGTAMTVGPLGGASIVSLSGTIPAATLLGLPEGPHTIYIHAHEIPAAGTGRWGKMTLPGAAASLVIDRTGPSASNPSVQPTPNNGTLNGPGNLGFLNAVRATVSLSDAASGGSDVVLAEAFLGGAAAPAANQFGTGAEMVPASGQWGGVSQTAYAFLPLAEISAQPEGIVNIWMHGKDSAGNWGAAVAAHLVLDKTPPTVTAHSASGTTIQLSATDLLRATVNSNIVAAEWFVGVDPGPGNGHPVTGFTPANPVTFSFSATAQPPGTTLNIRVLDAAGNWSNVTTQVIP